MLRCRCWHGDVHDQNWLLYATVHRITTTDSLTETETGLTDDFEVRKEIERRQQHAEEYARLQGTCANHVYNMPASLTYTSTPPIELVAKRIKPASPSS
jgi:hypothetical protein